MDSTAVGARKGSSAAHPIARSLSPSGKRVRPRTAMRAMARSVVVVRGLETRTRPMTGPTPMETGGRGARQDHPRIPRRSTPPRHAGTAGPMTDSRRSFSALSLPGAAV